VELSYYISTGNIVLLLILLTSYVSIYRKVKSSFTLGLIIFTLTLMIQNISHAVTELILLLNITPQALNLPTFVALLGYNPIYMLIPDVLEFIGLSILIYITNQ
jgi:hypothetical protein